MKLSKELCNPSDLGQVLQQARMMKDVSQRELASSMGVGQKWVWEMEQGKPGLLMERLFKMLELTGVKLYAELDSGVTSQGGDRG